MLRRWFFRTFFRERIVKSEYILRRETAYLLETVNSMRQRGTLNRANLQNDVSTNELIQGLERLSEAWEKWLDKKIHP